MHVQVKICNKIFVQVQEKKLTYCTKRPQTVLQEKSRNQGINQESRKMSAEEDLFD